MRQWPKVVYKEECMREGMQIEDVNIPVEQKVRLLDAISETGLKNIVVGSFVSPKYTPQMACIDEILRRLILIVASEQLVSPFLDDSRHRR